MRNTQRLESARMSLAQAITRSTAAGHPDDPDGRAAAEHVLAAELRLRRGGREDLGCQLPSASGDVTSSDARVTMREICQKLDAELEPDVTTGSFVAASDGGQR